MSTPSSGGLPDVERRSPLATEQARTTYGPECPVLCLSGGGFRATLFHLGALRRLNECGVLSRVGAVTSVSGGSILNGVLARSWHSLQRDDAGRFTNLETALADPVRQFCRVDLRTPLLLGSRLRPSRWPSLIRDWGAVSGNELGRSYKALFDDALLASVREPEPGKMPRFVFCATCVHTGACWHFHSGPGGRMGDFYTGYTDTGGTTIAEAVAASSVFPPAFAGFRLRTSDRCFSRIDPWGEHRELSSKRAPWDPVAAGEVTLTDGGVYDNLGVETIWDRSVCVLVSDAGRPFRTMATCRQRLASRLSRAASISMEQVGAVRKRWLIERIESSRQTGAYWGIDTRIEEYPIDDAVGYGPACRSLFASVRTDFNAFSDAEICCLENHGYTLADAAIRSRCPRMCLSSPPAKPCWPHGDCKGDDFAMRSLANSASRTLLRDSWSYLRSASASALSRLRGKLMAAKARMGWRKRNATN